MHDYKTTSYKTWIDKGEFALVRKATEPRGMIIEFSLTDTVIDACWISRRGSASYDTIWNRVGYGGRKGRSAMRRLLDGDSTFAKLLLYAKKRYGL